jgi:hypothetical protein
MMRWQYWYGPTSASGRSEVVRRDLIDIKPSPESYNRPDMIPGRNTEAVKLYGEVLSGLATACISQM